MYIDICNDYLVKIDRFIRYEKKQFDIQEICSLLMLIAEVQENSFTETNEKTLELLMYMLRDQLYKKTISNIPLSLFGGVSQIGFSLDKVSKMNNKYLGFKNSIDVLIQKYFSSYVNNLEINKNDFTPMHYDFIMGIAGILNYLLEDPIRFKDSISLAEEYLIKMIMEKKMYNHHLLPGWTVSGENQFIHNSTLFQNGSIDYGFAHGISGVLSVLVKSKSIFREKENLDPVIKSVVKELMQARVEIGCTYVWPGMLRVEDYQEGKFSNGITNYRNSWCYGSSSILFTLKKGFHVLQELNSERLIEKKLLESLNSSSELQGLVSPTLCHGYSGVLLLSSATKRLCRSEMLIKSKESMTKKIMEYTLNGNCEFPNIEESIDTTSFNYEHTILSGTPGVLLSLLNDEKENVLEKYLLVN